MSNGPTLVIRVAFDEETDHRNLGRMCGHVADMIVEAANATLVAPRKLPRMTAIDAKWATPVDEWRKRGGGW